jgi:hypothetical protein
MQAESTNRATLRLTQLVPLMCPPAPPHEAPSPRPPGQGLRSAAREETVAPACPTRHSGGDGGGCAVVLDLPH